MIVYVCEAFARIQFDIHLSQYEQNMVLRTQKRGNFFFKFLFLNVQNKYQGKQFNRKKPWFIRNNIDHMKTFLISFQFILSFWTVYWYRHSDQQNWCQWPAITQIYWFISGMEYGISWVCFWKIFRESRCLFNNWLCRFLCVVRWSFLAKANPQKSQMCGFSFEWINICFLR